jgi:hypothetical protein
LDDFGNGKSRSTCLAGRCRVPLGAGAQQRASKSQRNYGELLTKLEQIAKQQQGAGDERGRHEGETARGRDPPITGELLAAGPKRVGERRLNRRDLKPAGIGEAELIFQRIPDADPASINSSAPIGTPHVWFFRRPFQ